MFLQAAALGKQLFDITDSELALGLLGLVEFLPALVLLPLTGSAADRFDRRRVAAIALAVEVADVGRCSASTRASDPTSALPLFVIAAALRHRPGVRRARRSARCRRCSRPTGGLPRLIALLRRRPGSSG